MKTVQARLDPDTEKILARLVDQLGMSCSMVLREGISRKIAGLGRFSCGISDLGSSAAEGCGRTL